MLRILKTYKLTLRFLKYVVILIIGQNLATELVVGLGYNLTPFFLLEVNFDKFTIRLYLLLISLILAKFLDLKINNYIINKLFKLQNFKV